jgi:hypothetical protein
MKAKATFSLAVIAILALILAVTGLAAKPRYKSTVTVTGFDPYLTGKVSSPKAACVKGRLVTVYAERLHHPDTAAGSDRTNRYGRWTITDDDELPFPDQWGAYVKAASAAHKTFICQFDRYEIGGN